MARGPQHPEHRGPLPFVWRLARHGATVVVTVISSVAKTVTGQSNGYNTLPATPPKAPDEYRP